MEVGSSRLLGMWEWLGEVEGGEAISECTARKKSIFNTRKINKNLNFFFPFILSSHSCPHLPSAPPQLPCSALIQGQVLSLAATWYAMLYWHPCFLCNSSLNHKRGEQFAQHYIVFSIVSNMKMMLNMWVYLKLSINVLLLHITNLHVLRFLHLCYKASASLPWYFEEQMNSVF